MERNTILKTLNQIGEKIGYPFYVFKDGSFSKRYVNGKMNAIMIVRQKFVAEGLEKEAPKPAFCSSKPAINKNGSANKAKSVAANGRKLTPKEEVSLKQAELSLLSQSYPDKQGLELVCKFGSPELLQEMLFERELIKPDNTNAWKNLLDRTDIPLLQKYIISNLEKQYYPLVLCQILLLKSSNENVLNFLNNFLMYAKKWKLMTTWDGYEFDTIKRRRSEIKELRLQIEDILIKRCIKTRNFNLLNEYVTSSREHLWDMLQQETERTLISAATKDEEVCNWFKAYCGKKS